MFLNTPPQNFLVALPPSPKKLSRSAWFVKKKKFTFASKNI